MIYVCSVRVFIIKGEGLFSLDVFVKIEEEGKGNWYYLIIDDL